MCVCGVGEDVRGDDVEREVKSGKAKRSRLWLGARELQWRIVRGSVASGGDGESGVVCRSEDRIGQRKKQERRSCLKLHMSKQTVTCGCVG
jgi:hypothetical protein